MDQTDQAYVERCREGNPDDFAPLVERHQASIYGYLSGLLRNAGLAEEAAQESFVRAFFALAKLRKPASFHSWLIGIASRVAKEYGRSFRRQYHDGPPPDEVPAETAEDDGRVEEAVAALPESYRQIILLRYYEDLSCLEIAHRLSMPLGTVTKMLSRAYGMLREKLRSGEIIEAPTPLENSL